MPMWIVYKSSVTLQWFFCLFSLSFHCSLIRIDIQRSYGLGRKEQEWCGKRSALRLVIVSVVLLTVTHSAALVNEEICWIIQVGKAFVVWDSWDWSAFRTPRALLFNCSELVEKLRWSCVSHTLSCLLPRGLGHQMKLSAPHLVLR